MKRVFILIPFLACLLCTSCIDVLEEFFINKDGSGQYLITYDLSSVMEPEFQSMLGGMAEMSGDESTNELNFNDLTNVELDSTSSFEAMAAEFDLNETQRNLLSRSFLHMEVSGASKIMKMGFEINFKDPKEIEQFFELLTQIQPEESSMLPLDMFSAHTNISIKKNILTRSTDGVKEVDSEVESSMAMMGMFFSEAVYTTKYYFPKKIKNSTLKGATIEGNVLTQKNSFLDVMLSKADISGEIKFK